MIWKRTKTSCQCFTGEFVEERVFPNLTIFAFFFSKFNNFCFDFIRDREFMDFIELSRGQVSEDAGSKGNCQKYKNHSEKTEN